MPIQAMSTGLPQPLTEALRRNAARQSSSAAAPVEGPTFAGALDNALRSVSASQNEATRLAESFQSDPASVNLEDAMVAMQKAQIGFQSATHVRNRLVSAYTDIMNMQV